MMHPDANRGVSPVIGVILMVAVTVMLAAVVGVFVLSMDTGSDAPPQITVEGQNERLSIPSASVSFEHTGGETVPEATQDIRIQYPDGELVRPRLSGSDGTYSIGDELSDDSTNINQGDVVRLVWVGGDRQTVLAEYTVQ